MRTLLLAPVLLCAACGHGAITAADFPAAFAQASSAPVSLCRLNASYLAQQDLSDARDSIGSDLTKALRLGRSSFDPQQAQACLDELSSRTCAHVADSPPASCWNAVRGLVPDGSACSWFLECQHGFCSGDNGCPSTCVGGLPAGAECPEKGTNKQCDARLGLTCIASVCRLPVAAGAACDPASPLCAAGLYCDQLDRACEPQHNAQVTCGADDECADGLYCQLSSGGGLCRKKVAQGSPCGEDADHAQSVGSECQDDLLCAGFARKPLRPGVCRLPGDVGAACTASADVNGCATGLNCSNGTCAMPPGPGQACFNGACLRSSAWCDANGQCQALLADGAACTQGEQCASRDCDSAGTGKCVTPESLHACHEP